MAREWHWNYVVSAADGSNVSEEKMQELWNKWIEAVESLGLRTGGAHVAVAQPQAQKEEGDADQD